MARVSIVRWNLKEAGDPDGYQEAYEQKLHIRRGIVGDVAKETKAHYCTEYYCVNAEAT
ncbi:MAG: hypothetical protein ABJB11_16045 [Ferruginibacter sp.]